MESGGLGKAAEQGVGNVRFGAKFGMKLAGHEPRMAGNLDHFHQIRLRVGAANPQTGFFQGGAVGVVELITVTVTLASFRHSVSFLGEGT